MLEILECPGVYDCVGTLFCTIGTAIHINFVMGVYCPFFTSLIAPKKVLIIFRPQNLRQFSFFFVNFDVSYLYAVSASIALRI